MMNKVLLFLLPIVALVTADADIYGGYGPPARPPPHQNYGPPHIDGYGPSQISEFGDDGSDLPEDQVEQVLALYRKHCKSSYGQYGEPSSLGNNVNIVCKEGRDVYEPPKKQIIRIPPGEKPKKNIIFVEAPAYKFKHNIEVIPSPQEPPKTLIYVLRGKASHSFDIQSKFGPQVVAKPQVFFLSNNPSNPPTQPPIYGLPDKPTITYGIPQASQQNPTSVVLSNLGPEYEVDSADSNTQSVNYQNIQTSSSSNGQSSILTQMTVPSSEGQLTWTDNPVQVAETQPSPTKITSFFKPQSKQTKISNTKKVTATLVQPTETETDSLSGQSSTKSIAQETRATSEKVNRPEQPQEPSQSPEEENNVLTSQPLKGNLFSSLNGNGGSYGGGEVRFPSESIQNLQFSSSSGSSRNSLGLTSTSSSNSNNFSSRRPTVIHTSRSISAPAPQKPLPRLNLFDIKFVRGLIDSARNTPVAQYMPKASLYNPSTRFSTSMLIPYTTFSSPGENSGRNSQKRSVKESSFEIIHAPFVSYSYSKSNIEHEDQVNT